MSIEKLNRERRRFTRHPFGEHPCKISFQGHCYTAEVLDYSEEGCKVSYLPALSLNDQVEIDFVFEFGYLHFKAQVKWISENSGLGLEFL